jgi:hypothetical protein
LLSRSEYLSSSFGRTKINSSLPIQTLAYWKYAKRSSKPKRPKRPRDINQLAHELVRESTEEPDEQPVSRSDISRVMREMGDGAVKLAAKGGLKQ